MNAFVVSAVVIGLLTGVCTVLNMRAVLRIIMVVGFFLVWGRIEADPMQSVALAIIMLVGAAIVIAFIAHMVASLVCAFVGGFFPKRARRQPTKVGSIRS